MTPLHKWTHDGDRVLLVKCTSVNGKSYGGFQWPEKGIVKPEYASTKPDCYSGGLFGWPWGLHLGVGKEPNYAGRWIVFAANPDDVIEIEHGKAKVVTEAEVIYCGSWSEALALTLHGRLAWLQYRAAECATEAQAAGDNDVPAASSDNGAAMASGENSVAVASGDSGAAVASGYRGAAVASGDGGVATASGYRGAATALGNSGTAVASGCGGAVVASGNSGVATASSYSGAAMASGCRGAATASSYSGAAMASGYRGAATALGDSGAAVASGDSGAAMASGDSGAACITSNYATICVTANATGLVTANRFYWDARNGAIIFQRWAIDDGFAHTVLRADELGLTDGDRVLVKNGKIQKTENAG